MNLDISREEIKDQNQQEQDHVEQNKIIEEEETVREATEIIDELHQQVVLLLNDSGFRRPDFNNEQLFNKKGDLQVMQLDCGYYVDKNINESQFNHSVIRLFCLTEEGYTILLHIQGYYNYFYIQLPLKYKFKEQEYVINLKQKLNQIGKKFNNELDCVSNIEVVKRQNFEYYSEKEEVQFLKIFTYQPAMVKILSEQIVQHHISDKTFESDIPYVQRFMIDRNIVGMGWLKLAAGQFKVRSENKKTSHCQIEIDVQADYIEGIMSKNQQRIDIAPLRILSFNIKCSNEERHTNISKSNQIIQIAIVLKILSHKEDQISFVLTLKQSEQIPGAHVFCFQQEKQLLLGWKCLVQHLDPDIIFGYNIRNFDLQFIMKRAQELEIIQHFREFTNFEKLAQKQTKEKCFIQDNKKFKLKFEGRIVLDLIFQFYHEKKLSCYSLPYLLKKYLGEFTEELNQTTITQLQNGNAVTRRRLAECSLKEANMSLCLMKKLNVIIQQIEMARLTGVSLYYLIKYDYQKAIRLKICREVAKYQFVLPTQDVNEKNKDYHKDTYLEVTTAFHDDPIVSLKFDSLYTSIMIAYNICYSTAIKQSEVESLDPQTYNKYYNLSKNCDIISENQFIKESVRKGILPQILQDVNLEVIQFKEKIKNNENSTNKMRLKARKYVLQSFRYNIYKFIASRSNNQICLSISQSVTSIAKDLIESISPKIKNLANQQYGQNHEIQVINCDKNYLNVNFNVKTIPQAIECAEKAVEFLNNHYLQKPIQLKFKNVICPYLLLNKKKSAGLLVWKNQKPCQEIFTKGIESTLLNHCQLVQNLIHEVLNLILKERSPEAAKELIKTQISLLFENKIDISQLVISERIRIKSVNIEQSRYKRKRKIKMIDNQQIVSQSNTRNFEDVYNQTKNRAQRVENFQQQDKATEAKCQSYYQDNLPEIFRSKQYVIIKSLEKKVLEQKKDPIEVLKNNSEIDLDHYLKKQLEPQLMQIMNLIITDANELFKVEHSKIRYQPKQKQNVLEKYYPTKQKCLCCKKAIDVYTKQLIMTNQITKQYAEVLATCQNCQGSLFREVICQNRACPVLYKRMNLKNEQQGVQADLDRFNAQW